MESEATIDRVLKIVTVGDDLVGKSCAIANFSTAVVPVQRQSTVFESSTATVNIDGVKIPLQLWDTTGKNEYREMIKPVYQGADIFLIFFSVVNAETYQNAVNKWHTEVNEANGMAVKIFVGNKIDLRRESIVENVVQASHVVEKVERQLSCKYLECSALTGEGLRGVFEYGVRELLRAKHANRAVRRKNQDGGCCRVM